MAVGGFVIHSFNMQITFNLSVFDMSRSIPAIGGSPASELTERNAKRFWRLINGFIGGTKKLCPNFEVARNKYYILGWGKRNVAFVIEI